MHCVTAKYFYQVIFVCLNLLTKLCFLSHLEFRRMEASGHFYYP